METTLWRIVKNSPRNTVFVVTSKDNVFKAATINEALARIQIRHPFLHSVFMSLPFVGPYFALSLAPLLVRDLAARELMDFDAQRTYELQVQGVIDNELNAKFYSPYTDFLERLATTRVQHAIDTEREKRGEIEAGTGVTKQDVAQQVPQLPLLRATLVNSTSGLGQSLVLTLPQLIADGSSGSNLVKEILESIEQVEDYAARGETLPDPTCLPCMNSMDEFFPRRAGGLGALFPTLRAWYARWRRFQKLKVSDLERFHAWIPNDTRVIRALKGTVPASTIKELKKRAEEEGMTLGNTLGAAAAAATHEIFFAEKESALLPTQVWVDLRPHFDVPIDAKHLGLLSGLIHGHVKSNVGDSIWEIAKQIKELNTQVPDDALRSNRWIAKWTEYDRTIVASRPPNEAPIGTPVSLSPLTMGNLGTLNIPESIVKRFNLDSVSPYFGQSENTRFTTFSSLPNGDLSITVTFPDLIFKRSDIQEYIDAIRQHIQSTADGR